MVRLTFLNYNEKYNPKENRTVMSFSLYGNANKYIGGLLENCRIINRVFPNFWIYVYVGNDFDHSIFGDKFIAINNIYFIYTNLAGHINASMRFTTIDRDEVSSAFSRDCDSRINNRDIYCITKFMESYKKFQIIRDHPEHNAMIMAGMWGIKKGLLRKKVSELLFDFRDKMKNNISFGGDQLFLEKYIYPLVLTNSLVFSGYYKRQFAYENPIDIEVQEEFVYGCRDHVGFIHIPVDLSNPFDNFKPNDNI